MSNSKENANGEKADEVTFNIGEEVSGFKLVKKIDEGGFGQVFKVTKDNKTFYAMKLESNFQEGGSAIKLEINVLKQLPRDTVFPGLIAGGKKARYHYLVLELLGDNLKMLRARSQNPEVWSDGTWSRIGIQCLYAIKMMHDAGFVHRDIKPNNFAIGLNTTSEIRSRRVLLFDFGLARKFVQKVKGLVPVREIAVSKKDGGPSKVTKHQSRVTGKPSGIHQARSKNIQHNRKDDQQKMKKAINRQFLVPPKGVDGCSQRTAEEKPEDEGYAFRQARPHTDFRGTHQYASPNAHLQKELGRHDDIWSLMYMIAEFFIELPWTNNDDIPVEELKNQSSLLRLFTDDKNPGRLTQEMRGQLNEIDKMLKSLNYYDCPNYDVVYQFLKDSMNKSKVGWDTLYDWETSGGPSEIEQSKGIKARKKNHYWENPGVFFKKSRWATLKMPFQSPPASTKVSSVEKGKRSVTGFRKSDFGRHERRRQMSKEDSADGDEVVPKAPTPAQKSLKKDPDMVESKKG